MGGNENYNSRIQSYQKILLAVNNDRNEGISFIKYCTIEKDNLKLNKKSSSLLNSSLMSTRDIHTYRAKNFKSPENEKSEVTKMVTNNSKRSKSEF